VIEYCDLIAEIGVREEIAQGWEALILDDEWWPS
jgi:hypothetical protein